MNNVLLIKKSTTMMLTLAILLSIAAPATAQQNRISSGGNSSTAPSQRQGPTDSAEMEAFVDALFAPELRARWIGAWDFFVLFVIASVFNNFLSEEFLFRGVLLPKMKGVFGRWDWVANGVIFGLYHLHQPWGIPGNILFGWLVAFTGKRYHSNWFPITLHSGQAFYSLAGRIPRRSAA
jgi:hypothetical protein